MATIRTLLGQQAARYLKVAAVGWLVFVVSVMWRAVPPALMIGSFIAVTGAMLGILFNIRCPHCRARVPQIGLIEMWRPNLVSQTPTCPRCSARLDESI